MKKVFCFLVICLIVLTGCKKETYYISNQNNLVITQDAYDMLPDQERMKWDVYSEIVYKHEAKSAHTEMVAVEYSTSPDLQMYEYAVGTEDGKINEYCIYSVLLPIGLEFPPNEEYVLLNVEKIDTKHTKVQK